MHMRYYMMKNVDFDKKKWDVTSSSKTSILIKEENSIRNSKARELWNNETKFLYSLQDNVFHIFSENEYMSYIRFLPSKRMFSVLNCQCPYGLTVLQVVGRDIHNKQFYTRNA
ncbi:hypothetical protein NPIL_647511 [Nephila pilipes]|uniref:Uncharacterized protein n=1 Tax=Nephila pilipes TaxID=299642 RepID=A0A8X6PGT2_NEPPI|nr:hypothetical protein NPIL_647511 [Nephila pilipes]